MANIESIEKTVAQQHVVRKVHELVKLRSLRGYYVKAASGGHVKQRAAGANMSVDVDALTFYLDNVETSIATTSNVVVEAADLTKPRIDVLYIDTLGLMQIAKGTPADVVPTGETVWQKYEEPFTADLSSIEGVILAEILVPAGATSILDAYIRELGFSVAVGGDICNIVTSVGPVGSDSVVPSEQAVREAITAAHADTVQRLSGTSTGTGADQEITHGFGSTWTHLKIKLVHLETGALFSNYVEPAAGSLDHFHVTVTSGKNWMWIADSW